MTDKEIVNGILSRDIKITKEYFYEKYYPLFKSVYNNCYTDSSTCLEFINDIYIYLLTPGKKTLKSPLESFNFECSLGSWLKIVCVNYCKRLFKKKKDTQTVNIDDISDSFLSESESLILANINKDDVENILKRMPNERYRNLIRLHFLECKTNEETANLLEMTMSNYYNKKLLAEKQLLNILKEEGLI